MLTRLTSIANYRLPIPVSNSQETGKNPPTSSLAMLGAELVFVQDASGQYLSFHWQHRDYLRGNPEQHVGEQNCREFTPVDKVAYWKIVQQVLTDLIPQRCQCLFTNGQDFFELDLVISPILPALGNCVTSVLVMGRLLQTGKMGSKEGATTETPVNLLPVLRSEKYKQLLEEIANNIRRTLDLDTLWQQIVDSLGKGLGLERCIICPYKGDSSQVQVIAEYRQPTVNSILSLGWDINSEPTLSQALSTLKPVVGHKPTELVVATADKNKPNALICLTLEDGAAGWTGVEKELVQELAEHVGVAIAHATLYKELEEARASAEESSRLKSEFLASMSHELRTPLNGIIGFIKIILDGLVDEPEEQTEFLQEAHNSSIHLLNIINDILDIAKIEAGKMELDMDRVKLGDLFADVQKFMCPQAERKNLSFSISMPPTHTEIVVYGNYQRLKQVMLNLVGNAIKFTHEGGVTISADVVRKPVQFQNKEFPGLVKVRVADTGIGVSLDKQDKLFQLFSQVDGSRTREFGGTGLGLTISQKLVEAMGGAVNFYSLGEGLGSTVTFTVLLNEQPVMVSALTNDDYQ
ncbi:MAG: ATP-binding protein [Nostocaceae cyanobacterium]|nr:ATP-binding protein [Nostocaceae cyanobacterium]